MLKCVAAERAEESNKYSNQDNATAFYYLGYVVSLYLFRGLDLIMFIVA